MNYVLCYFTMICVVLFFRRLCSAPPQYADQFNWWLITVGLVMAWPIVAPLAGAYTLGSALRRKIEAHNARVEQQTRSLK